MARAFLDPIKKRANFPYPYEHHVLRTSARDGARQALLRTRIANAASTPTAKSSCRSLRDAWAASAFGHRGSRAAQSVGHSGRRGSSAVGCNLREHRHVDFRRRVKDSSQNKDLGDLRAILSMLLYLIRREGPMTHAAQEAGVRQVRRLA